MNKSKLVIIGFLSLFVLISISVLVASQRYSPASSFHTTINENSLSLDFPLFSKTNATQQQTTPKSISNAPSFAQVHQEYLLEHSTENAQTSANWNSPTNMLTGRKLSTYVPPVNQHLNKTVLGFMPHWAVNGYYQNYDMQSLSVIAFFGLPANADGTISQSVGWPIWNGSLMPQIIDLAHSNGVKVVPVITNFSRSSITTFLNNPNNRTRLVNNIVAQIEAKNADGVNLDFEYAGTATDDLRAKYASFVDQVADAVHAARPGSHVSVCVSAGSMFADWKLFYDVAALGRTSVDYVMPMEYGFYSKGSSHAGPVAPLYGAQYWYTVSRSIRDIIRVVPSTKVLMGIPYYGLEFPVVASEWTIKNAHRSGVGGVSTYKSVMSDKSAPYHTPSSLRWNDIEKIRWYIYRYPNPSSGPGYWQGYYEDEASAGAKYDYVYEKNLGGIGIWTLGMDNGYREMWNAIRDGFSNEPIIVVFKSGTTRAQQSAIHTLLNARVDSLLNDELSAIVSPQGIAAFDLMEDYRARPEVAGVSYFVDRSIQPVK